MMLTTSDNPANTPRPNDHSTSDRPLTAQPHIVLTVSQHSRHIALRARDRQECAKVPHARVARVGRDAQPDDADNAGKGDKGRAAIDPVRDDGEGERVDGGEHIRRSGEHEGELGGVALACENDGEEEGDWV